MAFEFSMKCRGAWLTPISDTFPDERTDTFALYDGLSQQTLSLTRLFHNGNSPKMDQRLYLFHRAHSNPELGRDLSIVNDLMRHRPVQLFVFLWRYLLPVMSKHEHS